jgi:hypothetical protein
MEFLARVILPHSNGWRLQDVEPHLYIVNDAGPMGIGGTLVSFKQSMATTFRKLFRSVSQNKKELRADVLSAKFFIVKYNLKDMVIGILSDNSTSVSYVNGRMSVTSLASESVDFLRWAWAARNIRFVADHIPGTIMVEIGVDNLSRISESFKEWTLQQEVFWTTMDWAREMYNARFDNPVPID